MEITPQDREEFKYYTDGAIIGIKIVRSMTSEELKQTLKDKAKHEELRQRIGKDTNPSWVVGRVAEELYNRNEIDERQLDFINEYGGLEMPL